MIAEKIITGITIEEQKIKSKKILEDIIIPINKLYESSLKNLVIGNTSQLAHYFPDDYEKISSRDIDFTNNKKYNRVYICFAEQRTYMQDNKEIFYNTNIDYTLKVIHHFSNLSNNIIVYGTSELWNKCYGQIDINTPFNHKQTDYINSKRVMVEIIKELRKTKFPNIIILHPFNFNSIHRKDGFLFAKVLDSVVNKKKITIGDTYFYRELLHPKFVVEQSINATEDQIIGAGRVIFVNDFIRSLYSYFSLEYNDFVTEDINENITTEQNIFYLKSKHILYKNLYNDTIRDIEIKNNLI